MNSALSPSSIHTSPPRRPRRRSAVLVLGVVALLAAGCGSGGGGGASGTTTRSGAIRKVPADYATIQQAVTAAASGDLILVSPGLYKEAVTVETDNVVIRGTDRNQVIIDGEFQRENGIKVFSNGVAVENLTVRNHTSNGVFFTGDYGKGVTLTGYRVSYVTAYNNGLYGLYAFNATKGQFDHNYGSGHPDSAFYVGQCNPCDAVLIDNTAELNMLGYSGTNSTGVTIVRNTFRRNRSGIDPNSLYSEKLFPNSGTTIVGNSVSDNNSAEAPNNASFSQAYGTGIVLGGVSNNMVERNLVTGHRNGGIVITDLPTSTNPQSNKPESFKPENNQVRANRLSGNTVDLVYLTVNYASKPFGNCFAGNTFTSTFPDGLETSMPCENAAANQTDLGDLSGILGRLTPAPPDVDWKKVAAPPDQPQMPDAATAPARPAVDVPQRVDVAAISLPSS